MNDTQKMINLLRRLKVEMNGAVVDGMRERGIEYAMSYGVSVPTIRDAAKEYAPDHKLALLLYKQDVRELKLAAMIIAEPEKITQEEVAFWSKGVINVEMAEHLATQLISRSDLLQQIVQEWLVGNNDLLRYAALLALSHRFMMEKSGRESGWLCGEGDAIWSQLEVSLQSESRFVWQGAANLLGRIIWGGGIEQKNSLKKLIGKLDKGGFASAKYLERELGWMIGVGRGARESD